MLSGGQVCRKFMSRTSISPFCFVSASKVQIHSGLRVNIEDCLTEIRVLRDIALGLVVSCLEKSGEADSFSTNSGFRSSSTISTIIDCLEHALQEVFTLQRWR